MTRRRSSHHKYFESPHHICNCIQPLLHFRPRVSSSKRDHSEGRSASARFAIDRRISSPITYLSQRSSLSVSSSPSMAINASKRTLLHEDCRSAAVSPLPSPLLVQPWCYFSFGSSLPFSKGLPLSELTAAIAGPSSNASSSPCSRSPFQNITATFRLDPIVQVCIPIGSLRHSQTWLQCTPCSSLSVGHITHSS